MSTPEELLAQYGGRVVPFSFSPGFVALSYCVSLVGAMSTLELISRRTSHKGIYNHVLLVGAAICMGGISIWSMHFIGNKAIFIDKGEDELHILYSTRTTVLSLFLPILVLLLAFLAVTTNDRVQWWRIGLSGFLSGSAICGMHYLGNASIENYRCEYAVANIVGAAVIAVAACTIALSLFFVMQAAWTISWWRKIACAMLLAGAVSGMHWCAAVGTKYRLLHLSTGLAGISRETTIIVVICLSVAACIILVASVIYSARARLRYATKAQLIVLATAVFDKRGRILVNQDGLLPSEVITDTIIQKSSNDVFGTTHPLFHWMFRASRNWPSIVNFLDGMASHVAHLPTVSRGNRTHLTLTGTDGQMAENYDLILRERFCLAAAALASKTNNSLSGAGVLWDEIFPTGGPALSRRAEKEIDEAERGVGKRQQEYGRGSLMFLVRHVDNERVAQNLETIGYRFVEQHQVAGIIRSSMQIKSADFGEKLGHMAAYAENKAMLAPGVHVGMFAVRARLDYGGFDVLVNKDRRNVLPTIRLPTDHLERWQAELLRRLDGLKMPAVLQHLDDMADGPELERQFASELHDAITALRDLLEDAVFEDATLISKVMQVPCSAVSGNSRPLASLIAFRLVLGIHHSANRAKFDFSPLQLFKVQQLVDLGSQHQVAFSHAVHRELSSVLGARAPPAAAPTAAMTDHLHLNHRQGRMAAAFRRVPLFGGRSRAVAGGHQAAGNSKHMFATSQERLSASSFSHGGDQSSYDGDAKSPSFDRDVPLESLNSNGNKKQQQQQFGGIMVSQQITVNVDRAGHSEYSNSVNGGNGDRAENASDGAGMDGSASGLSKLYTGPEVRALDVEAERTEEKSTFVDELIALCMNQQP